MRKILLIGLGVAAATLLLSVITASLMAAPLPSDLTLSAAVAASHHLARLPDGTIGVLYYNQDDGSGQYNVLFIHSSDNGHEWSAPDTLNRISSIVTPYDLMKEPPDVAMAADGDLFAVWDAADGTRGSATDVFFSYRDHDIGTWTEPARIAIGIGEATGPRIALSHDRALHVVYYDEGTASQIWHTRNTTEFTSAAFRVSADGDPWSLPDSLTAVSDGYAQNPAIVTDGGEGVHVFYGLCVDPGAPDYFADQLRYRYSDDQGVTWAGSLEITHRSGQATLGVGHPTAVALPESAVAVVWLDDDESQLTITSRSVHYAIGQPPPYVWTTVENLTPGEMQVNLPTLAADSLGRLDLCYEAQPATVGLRDIFHRSKDPGQAWSLTAENLSQTPAFDTTAPGIIAESPAQGAPARPGFLAAWVEQIAFSPPRDLFELHFGLSDDRVLPGDTNNDGTVDAGDVLPLIAYWDVTGPARADRTSGWSIHPVSSWTPWQAGFADASGDGVVNAHDVIPIGLNWGQTHVITGPSLAPALASLDPAAFTRAAEALRAALGGATATGHSAEMVRVIDDAMAVVNGGAGSATGGEAGTALSITSARPNPSGGDMHIRYRLATEAPVSVVIFDSRGRRVRTLISGTRPAGDGEAVWDGKDERGLPAPAGMYLARIEAAGRTSSQKIVRSR